MSELGTEAVGEAYGRLDDIPPAEPAFSDDDVDAILEAVAAALRRGVLTKGPLVAELEAAYAQRLAIPHALAFNSGTSALEAVYRACGVASGEVVVPANTFVATAAAAVAAGARVRFVDIELELLGPSADMLAAAITDETRAFALCHIGGGIAPNVRELLDVCADASIVCIEDAAQAQGAALDGIAAGTFGDAAIFSLFPAKVMTAGEGGVLVTSDPEIAAHAGALRDQGRTADKQYRQIGFNGRMPEASAAIALAQLRQLDDFLAQREAIASHYDRLLANVPGVERPNVPPGLRPNWYKYWVLVESRELRDAVVRGLVRRGASYAGPLQGHTDPLHRLPCFAHVSASCPNADDFCDRHLSFPIYPSLRLEAAERIVKAVVDELRTLTS